MAPKCALAARVIAAALLVAVTAPSARAQSTAFTYQGQLSSNGQPANGVHDLRLKLFDAATGNGQVGATICVNNVEVINGTFSTLIDFGQQFTTPSPRFLEVTVRADIGQPCTDDFGYVTLAPRQQLIATPLAIHARSAFALDAADGSPANAVVVDNAGKVGIGTASPTHNVHIAAAGPTLSLQDTNPASQQAGYITYRDTTNVERAWVGYGTPGDPDFTVINARTSGDVVIRSLGGDVRLTTADSQALIVNSLGNVGIGTLTPVVKLDVRGDVHGFNAEFFDVQTANITGGPSNFSGDDGSFRNAVLVAEQTASSGNAIYGQGGVSSFNTNVIGVYGRTLATDSNSFGVFSAGRLAATGTKSFRIDHPEDPANMYLFHYCAESPEVINFYRGTVTLDAQGTAVVSLPPYFARINKDPSYQLTAVGAAMPNLYVSQEISDQALHAGALQSPGEATPACWFAIDGGVPHGKVSWLVQAVRNDEFVRTLGAPVELVKPQEARGKTDFPLH